MAMNLPLGSSNFGTLRANNEIYVDKTEMVYRLANTRGKLFLARPRRFGKSLLISTFESLFKYGLRDFQGLAIEQCWDDTVYPTVRLDFSEIKEFFTIDEFKQKFSEKLILKFEAVGFKFATDGVGTIAQLSRWFSGLGRSSLVILVDEYDAPLTNCLDQPRLFKEVRTVMSDFFLTLKSNEGCLRFFFMTGITKFSNTNIFSAFNNLQDISLNPLFGTILGYTEDEILEYFDSYLSKASESLKIPKTEVLNKLKKNYNGFCFDAYAQTHVFCPWSVLNFFNYPELGFDNYWYSSGGQPTVLMKYLTSHALKSPKVYNADVLVSLSELGASRQIEDISTEALLTQAGYLTIKESIGGDFVRVGYPNEEVSRSMARLYASELLRGQDLLQSGVPILSKILALETPDTVVDYFNRALTSIDYVRYPVDSEAACRAYLQVLMIGAALVPRVEVHNAQGRSDMEVEVGDRHWVFEFKYAKTEAQTEGLLAQAVDQVQSRHYGESTTSRELIRVALVFSAEQRRFAAWKVI